MQYLPIYHIFHFLNSLLYCGEIFLWMLLKPSIILQIWMLLVSWTDI
jgi:hypothetical protein